MVHFCLKLLYQYSKSINKCLGLQTARIEMDCSLKNFPDFFKFIGLCLGKLVKTQIMIDSLLENSLDIFLYKYFVYDRGK